jgi:hypothetical protein
VDPVPDPLLFFSVLPGIEPGLPDLQPRTVTTRPQRRSFMMSMRLKSFELLIVLEIRDQRSL